MTEHTGDSPMFAIFLVSILSIVVIPWTLYKFCGSSDDEEVVQPWMKKKQISIGERVRSGLTPSNVVLLALWAVWIMLLIYVQYAATDMAPFDPFEILQVDKGASDKDIKKAYRQLSLRYHPDKNPDPAAAKYFAESITKAYKALTDEVARKNYEKYGHPDGPQSMSMGVALPAWIFSKDHKTAPVLLIALIGGGVLLPLGLAACYLMRTNKYSGPGQMMTGTLEMFIHSKFAIKESQSLARIPETLVVAMEFITMPTPPEQEPALQELRKTIIRLNPELKAKPQFWKRKSSVIKVHMLLLAHIAREPIPAILESDLKFVLKKSPVFLEEMLKLSGYPRPPHGYGWLAPLVGCVEMMQCLMQAVNISTRKTVPLKVGAENAVPLMQLPHFDQDLIKRLGRRRVRSFADLADLPLEERTRALAASGLSDSQIEDVNVSILATPSISVAVRCHTQGEEGSDIMEEDLVTCEARVVLTRPSHFTQEFAARGLKGSGVQAFAPHFPHPKPEKWWFVLADMPNNEVHAFVSATLLEAEAVGAAKAQKNGPRNGEQKRLLTNGKQKADKAPARLADRPSTSDDRDALSATDDETQPLVVAGEAAPVEGQLVELRFQARKAGNHDLTLLCLSDCWVGCDRAYMVRLQVKELTRAEREGRTHRVKAVPADDAASWSGDSDVPEEDEDEAEEGEYDSEDSGTEESGSEAGDKHVDEDASDAEDMPDLVPAAARA
ncbi:hypothetical protein WJX72_004149 [[Myrmecia] bisecta]|uniref:J domain-containing protein n=1 Tax=[Myrmecia] bisecta TaxID=41462 RepID=A0AAW1R675_9CHLO